MIFNHIKFKNFLSYGNSITTFNFENKIVTISGVNGEGKSSVIEAIYFALTGKPHRNISKTKLINTTNKKDCYVELSFNVANDDYVVKRGIKPNLFEIYKNDTLIDEEANIKTYQTVLEEITGLTPKVIEQTLIISNRFYTPFLELSAGDKRTFTETIFGIDMLSNITTNLKIKLNSVKETETILTKDIERLESNIDIIKDMQSKVVDISLIKLDIKKSKERIVNYNKAIEDINLKNESLSGEIETLSLSLKNKDIIKEKFYLCKSTLSSLNNQQATVSQICPSCGYILEGDGKEEERELEKQNKIKLWSERLEKIQNKNNQLQLIQNQCNNLVNKQNENINKQSQLNNDIRYEEQNINRLKKELVNQSKINSDNENKIKELESKKEQLVTKKFNVTKEIQAITFIQKMLSEKGLRKFIFSKYVSVMNNFVNENLKKLSTNYQIIFDDEFNETIIGGGYDKLEYGNLSAGEKQRLDLSLMFAFLEIAKLKNNVNCNLLCCDEMFVSLDDEGVDGIHSIFKEMKRYGNSVVIITHEDRVRELGEVNYTAVKTNFSKLIRE